MKNPILVTIIGAFVLGVILTVFTYQAFTIYSLRAQVNTDHAVLTQVVDFLNKNIAATQPTSQTPAATAPTSTKK